MAKKKKVISASSKPAAKDAAVETKKKAKTAKVVVEAVEEEDEDDVEEIEEVEEEIVEEVKYVSDMRSMSLVTKSAEDDAVICKKLAKLKEPDERSSLVIQHALNLIRSEGNTTLALGEALFEIRANGYWTGVKDKAGAVYTRMETMWGELYEISPITGYRAIKLYEKLVVELGLEVKEIEQVPMTVWRAVVDSLNEENFDEIRKAIGGMTAREAAEFAKSIKKIGLEEAIQHKDDDVLPEGDDSSDDEDDEGDSEFDGGEEEVKTIKMVVAASTYELFNAMLDAATSLLPDKKGEKEAITKSRALTHILTDWSASCFAETDQCKDPEEYIRLQINAMEEAYGVKLFDDEDEEDDED